MPRRPKLGQHFLVDEQYQHRIVETLPPGKQDLVIEIGPGRGALTRLLAGKAAHVIAIEIDPVLARSLEERCKAEPGLEVLRADILETDVAQLCSERGFTSCFVFGNLPYYITSPVIHHLIRFRTTIQAMALVVQREVAERLTARPGNRHYGYLTVLAQLYTRPRIAVQLPSGAFSPPPRVRSALVRLDVLSDSADAASAAGTSAHLRNEPGFLEFVKGCFAEKRKTALNNLARLYPRADAESALGSLHLSTRARAEQLNVEQFAGLYRVLKSASPLQPEGDPGQHQGNVEISK